MCTYTYIIACLSMYVYLCTGKCCIYDFLVMILIAFTNPADTNTCLHHDGQRPWLFWGSVVVQSRKVAPQWKQYGYIPIFGKHLWLWNSNVLGYVSFSAVCTYQGCMEEVWKDFSGTPLISNTMVTILHYCTRWWGVVLAFFVAAGALNIEAGFQLLLHHALNKL